MSQDLRPRNIHRLSAAGVRSIKEPGWYGDGGGLYLEVDANGTKRWAMRLTVNGRRRDFGLGSINKVSLVQAREEAQRYRTLAYQGIDPSAERKARRVDTAPTFAEVAAKVHTQRLAIWSNGKHVEQWIKTLQEYAYPQVGQKRISEIGTPEVLAVLSPIWTTKPETARRVRQRLRLVLDWARAAGYRSGDNPVDLIGDALPRHDKRAQHHAALPYKLVPDFITKLRAGNAEPISKLAFEFLVLTATRSKETRGAKWGEFDLADALWTIPPEDDTGRRMKTGREHVVPLSPRCIEILIEAKTLMPKSEIVFPDNAFGRRMSENRFLSVRSSLGYRPDECTPHGFRSSFRDWAAEETSFQSEVVEMALAHTIKNKVEAAYRRGNLLAKRRDLMDTWAKFATGAATT